MARNSYMYLVLHLLYKYCIRINTRGAILSSMGLGPDEPHTRTFISVDFFSLLFIVQWDHCLLNLIVCHCDVYSIRFNINFFYCSLFNSFKCILNQWSACAKSCWVLVCVRNTSKRYIIRMFRTCRSLRRLHDAGGWGALSLPYGV